MMSYLKTALVALVAVAIAVRIPMIKTLVIDGTTSA
jgi:hypothetical protein